MKRKMRSTDKTVCLFCSLRLDGNEEEKREVWTTDSLSLFINISISFYCMLASTTILSLSVDCIAHMQ